IGRDDPLPHVFTRSIGGIFQFAAFVAEVPDVAVAAINIFVALFHRDSVLVGIGDGVFARIDIPFAPGSDNLQIGRNGFVGQFKAHLIVAFTGTAVGQSVSAKLQRE